MYHEDEDNYHQPNIEFLETQEKDMPSTYHETCENDEVEVTTLGNIEDFEVPNINDSASSDGKSNYEITKSSSFGLTDIFYICLICEKKIYPMEKLTIDGKLYHKNCFRCFKCRTILSASNFTLNNNEIYCKTHFMELFKIRGKINDNKSIPNEIITGNETETIPIIDTKGLLAKFRELETGNGSITLSLNPNSSNSNANQRYTLATDDVVRCDDLALDELPQPETAKIMVAKFKAMENRENVPSPKRVEQMQNKSIANATVNASVRLNTVQATSSVPVEEHNYQEELPEEGATKNLMSKFQNVSE